MLQAILTQTAGDTQRILLRYQQWLAHGETLLIVTTSVSGGTVTVTSATIVADGRGAVLLLHGGVAGETDIVTVTVTTSYGQTKQDTLQLNVMAP